MITKEGRTPRIMPFDMAGVARGADGVLRYTTLAPSLLEMFHASVCRHPDRECIAVLDGERLSYQETWARAARVAGGLRADGVRPGDRVAIRYGNGLPWCLSFWGALMCGAVAVPVNTRFAETEVDYVLDDSGATAILGPAGPLPDGAPFVTSDVGHDTLAALMYTSGTTGFPKGAMVTHENFLSNCETARRVLSLPEDMPIRNLIAVPLFHATGCNSQLLSTLHLGGTAVIMPAYEPQAFLRAAVEERITLLTAAPALFWLAMAQPNFAEFDLDGVGWVTYGGAPTSPEMIARLRTAFPNALLANGFGLTETSSISTCLPDAYTESRPETVGFAAPPVEVDLADVDPDTGVGELLIRGQNIVAGYWNKPDKTAETFVDGWLHTGDLARIDDDGFVQIVDRVKDMINRGGENVYCVEVENVLIQHPAVFDAAVVGVADEMMGEKVGAVVVPRPGSAVEAKDIHDFVAARIADYKAPQYVAVRDEQLPRNPAGKVLKSLLRSETRWGEQIR